MTEIDLKISGTSEVNGGEFRNIKISGSGKVAGDLRCNQFRSSGASRIIGSLEAENIHASGATNIAGEAKFDSASISGSFSCEKITDSKNLKLSGSCVVHGEVNLDTLESSGGFSAQGDVHSRKVKSSGGFKCDKDVEAEIFESSGSVQIGGLLNAETISICSGADSRIGSLGGGTITIKPCDDMNLLNGWLKIKRSQGVTVVESIEGDTITLAYVRAKIVRGNNVVIGEGCVIDRVEYSENLDALDGTVAESVKI